MCALQQRGHAAAQAEPSHRMSWSWHVAPQKSTSLHRKAMISHAIMFSRQNMCREREAPLHAYHDDVSDHKAQSLLWAPQVTHEQQHARQEACPQEAWTKQGPLCASHFRIWMQMCSRMTASVCCRRLNEVQTLNHEQACLQHADLRHMTAACCVSLHFVLYSQCDMRVHEGQQKGEGGEGGKWTSAVGVPTPPADCTCNGLFCSTAVDVPQNLHGCLLNFFITAGFHSVGSTPCRPAYNS